MVSLQTVISDRADITGPVEHLEGTHCRRWEQKAVLQEPFTLRPEGPKGGQVTRTSIAGKHQQVQRPWGKTLRVWRAEAQHWWPKLVAKAQWARGGGSLSCKQA